MARPEKPIDADGGAAAIFAKDLRKLRAQAGNPTYREMARSALFSSSVLSSAASGMRLPTLQVTLGFVAACGGDREVWRRRWMRVAGVTDSDAAANGRPRGAPVNTKRPLAHQKMPSPAQLPLRPCGYVDRRSELDRLCRAPAATPVVITGPTWACGSDFAMHYAHRIAEDMVDGQLYADFGPLSGTVSDAEYVLDGFLRALRLSADHLPGSVDQRAGLYRSILADSRLLVLLDNVRDEQQIRPLLAESRHSVTVVTSRTPLLGLGDVRRVRLKALPRVDSVAAITSALPERAEAEPRECDRLAGLCCDLPLALDIALRRLIARPDLSLGRANAALAEPGRALNWLSIGDVSLREALDSAYRELGEAARTLLTRIARLPAHRDLGTSTHEKYELAEELVEAGLLRHGGRSGTYRMERLVRAFTVAAQETRDERTVPPPRIDVPV